MPDHPGRKAWDVYRLIELSADLPVEQVPLETIAEVDTVYWFQAGDFPATVRAVIEHAQLIRDADLAYPILLGADGRVMDGMHRVCRAIMEGHATIAARRFVDEPEPDHRHVEASDLDYTGR